MLRCQVAIIVAIAAIYCAQARAQTDETTTLLRYGKLDEAVQTALRRYQADLGDVNAREECLRLHLALATTLMRDGQYAALPRVLAAVDKISPANAESRRIRRELDRARGDAPARVIEARRNIELEWFEPAYRTLEQAVALLPERRAEWSVWLQSAAEGAGDDHYFCKNFHKAFYYYDALLHSGKPNSDSLRQRWLQSLVFSLADDADRTRYPAAYWEKSIAAAEQHALTRGDPLLRVLRGLAAEAAGQPGGALRQYTNASQSVPSPGVDADAVRAARVSALAAARKLYDVRLSPRRAHPWSGPSDGEWQTLRSARFNIKHRNAAAAARASDVLDEHFSRIAALLGRKPEQIPWPVACEVTLHADAASFRAATSRGPSVTALNAIQLTNGRLHKHSLHLCISDPLLLASTIPHELTHLMLAAVAQYRPMPAAVNEGLALWVEPRCRHLQFARVLAAEGGPRPVAELLRAAEVHPAEERRFYAESLRLVTQLLARGNAAELVSLAGAPDTTAELCRRFGMKSITELDAPPPRKTQIPPDR